RVRAPSSLRCHSCCYMTCLDLCCRGADQALLSPGLCRYGNNLECCWGRRPMDRGRCQAHCQQGCKHGECVGPDRCKCHPGYTGKACNQDVNECGAKPRACKHRCMNTPGSYKCYCLDGYAAQPDGSCRNARTCYHANCQYGCEVMKGAVRCTCPSPGLRLGPDRRACVDIDECAAGGGVCPRRRKCVNTFGSFMCKCHLGFKLTYINGRYTCIESRLEVEHKVLHAVSFLPAVLKVTVEPQRPRSTRTTTPIITTTTTNASTASTSAITATIRTTTTTASVLRTTRAPSTPATSTATTKAPPITTSTSSTIPAAATTSTPELDTSTSTTLVPATATTTPSSLPPPPTVPPTALTMASTIWLVTTTMSNRIHEALTHRQRGDVHTEDRWPWFLSRVLCPHFCVCVVGVGALRCSFDHGLCDWMSDGEGDLHWEIVHNPAGGQYLSVPELKAGQKSIRGARLAVQIVLPWSHGDVCFSFSHWLTGHQVGTLQLFISKKGRDRSPAIWSRTGGHGWRHTQVGLTTHSLDQVLLKADRRKGWRGQIAVDDVTLRPGLCL
uniref:Nephronectin a n=1 Tax=Mola mola TaxID=94237 RepID=A0A3Q3WYU5_MOLML